MGGKSRRQITHPRPQGYPGFFPLTKWIGGSGDEDANNQEIQNAISKSQKIKLSLEKAALNVEYLWKSSWARLQNTPHF